LHKTVPSYEGCVVPLVFVSVIGRVWVDFPSVAQFYLQSMFERSITRAGVA